MKGLVSSTKPNIIILSMSKVFVRGMGVKQRVQLLQSPCFCKSRAIANCTLGIYPTSTPKCTLHGAVYTNHGRGNGDFGDKPPDISFAILLMGINGATAGPKTQGRVVK